jgi:putative RNA 2'-phosphotransferase
VSDYHSRVDAKRRVKVSKYLSKHLRHAPEGLGLVLQSGGWVEVDLLLAACEKNHFPISRAELDEVVATSDKQRFAFDESRARIRANQGHSVEVDLQLAPEAPPPTLYHGTTEASLEVILADGIRKMSRHHVHLSAEPGTATQVGGRRGRAVVLVVDSARMAADGIVFFRSKNGVWLVDEVPPTYLSRSPEERDRHVR